MKRLPFSSPIVILLLAGFWLLGFHGFIETISELQEPNLTDVLEPTEAVVVLTGGSERVATGLKLLKANNGKKLFISGVHKNLPMESVLKASTVREDLKNCCIALGYEAFSTYGNAEETKKWMKVQGYKSLRLVTANYHMPRSMLLFRATMPDTCIVPHPVVTENVKLDEWWEHPGTINLLATEYTKYLLVRVRLFLTTL